jgi:predicted nucleic acid-binding protein
MRPFLDASVLVEACLLHSPGYRAADELVRSEGACTSAHALAEAYATLSGDKRLHINPHDASEMVIDVSENLRTGALGAEQVLELIRQAPGQGVYGGTIYDAIHAETARQMDCGRIHTINVSHFRHVAPDMPIAPL